MVPLTSGSPGSGKTLLAKALRVDEIGDIERASNTARPSVRTDLLTEDTCYPFIINMPQHHLEPILYQAIEERCPGAVRLQHRLTGFRAFDDRDWTPGTRGGISRP